MDLLVRSHPGRSDLLGHDQGSLTEFGGPPKGLDREPCTFERQAATSASASRVCRRTSTSSVPWAANVKSVARTNDVARPAVTREEHAQPMARAAHQATRGQTTA